MRLRVDRHLVVAPDGLAGQRIEHHELVHLVAEELDPQRLIFVGRVDLDDVATDPEHAAVELVVVPLVLDFDEFSQDLLAIDALSALERQHHAVIRLGRSEAVDARHARDDDDVPPLEERPCGREPHAIDLFVDRRFLLDVGVGARDVRLGLVVVVVADEVLDGVLGEEAAEFLVELRRQGLVVRHDERRAIHARDRLRHRERLPRPGDAQQDLGLVAAIQPIDELVDRARLIAAQLEIRDQREPVVLGGHIAVSTDAPLRGEHNLRSYHRFGVRAGSDQAPPSLKGAK